MIFVEVATVMPAVLLLVHLPGGRGGGGRCGSACERGSAHPAGFCTNVDVIASPTDWTQVSGWQLWTRQGWTGGVDRRRMGGRRCLGDVLPKGIRMSA